MTDQIIAVNVHHPMVQRVYRLDGDAETLMLELSNGRFGTRISVFTTAENWRAANAKVERFLLAEMLKGKKEE